MLPLVSYKIFESTKDHPHRIKKSGEMMVQELNYQGVEFPVVTKHYGKIEEHICGHQYKETDVRVRDHCHITGQYRGSAHQDCNLKLQINPKEGKIPVIFHNLRVYDSHFIMQEMGSIGKKQKFEYKLHP